MVTDKTKTDSNSRFKTTQLSTILVQKNGIPGSVHRLRLQADAGIIQHCRVPQTDPKTGNTVQTKFCKQPLCPNCQTRIAKANHRALFDQFEEYMDSGRLYEIRFNIDCGNVRGKQLLRMMRRIVSAWNALTRRAVWKAVVSRAGAVIHATWKAAGDNHDAGYFVHLHAICLTAAQLPRFEAVLDEYKKILAAALASSSSSAPSATGDCFSSRPVENLSKAARYFTHWRKRVVGAPAIKSDTWLLGEIPDEDITAYITATKNRLRVLQRDFDPDILKISRRRFHSISSGSRVDPPVQPTVAEVVATYNLLSSQSNRLAPRFQKLADFLGKNCRPNRPCRLRACPRCLRRQLRRDLRAITKGQGKGEHLVSILLRAPGLAAPDNLEAEAAALCAAVKKLLRPSQLEIPASAWKFRVRRVVVDGRTLFRLSACLLVATTSTIDSTKLKSRWQRQLKSAGLRCRPEGKKATVVIRPVDDLDIIARKLVGRVKSILGPVKEMRPDEASAYLHVLAMRSDLVISDDWARSVAP